MIDLLSNTKTSEFYHEVLKLIPYNAFIEKIESTNTKIYCNGKRIKPTRKEIFIAIIYNLCSCPINKLEEEPILDWSYRNALIKKFNRLKENTKRNCMNYFRIKYNVNKETLKIYFSEISKNSRCKNSGYFIPYKSSTMILEIKKYE